jgi:hypothetical protein
MSETCKRHLDSKNKFFDLISYKAVSIAFCILTAFLSFGSARSDFNALVVAYTGTFFLYTFLLAGLLRSTSAALKQKAAFLTILGIALRLLLVFTLPNWSEDIWRFLWDGRLTVAGIHPFSHPPVWYFEQNYFPHGLHLALYEKLNSKLWYTVYPPLCQGIFALSAWLSPHSDYGAIIPMKLFLWGCECGTLWLFWCRRHYFAAVIWALNPLVLLEICGNGHFEGALVFATVGMFYALHLQRNALAGALCAFAFSIKLWPLLFMPLLAAWGGGRRFLTFFTVFSGASAALFLPVFSADLLLNMAQSLDLYFQKFAFNGSFYYLFWEFGLRFLTHYSLDKLIGLLLLPFPIVVLIGLSWQIWHRSRPSAVTALARACFWVFTVYLFCASTVHPWYVVFLLGLALSASLFEKPLFSAPCMPLVANQKYPVAMSEIFRYAVWPVGSFSFIWTWTVAFSYSHYEDNAFIEQKGWILAEYVLVGVCLFIEIRSRRKKYASLLP